MHSNIFLYGSWWKLPRNNNYWKVFRVRYMIQYAKYHTGRKARQTDLPDWSWRDWEKLQILRWLFIIFGKTCHILSWICLNFLRSEKLSTTKFWWLKDFVIISTVMSIFRNKNYNSEGGKSWQRILKTSGSHIAGKVDMIYQTSNSATEWLNISSEIVSHQWVLVCGCSGQVKLVFHCPGFKGVNPPIDYLH